MKKLLTFILIIITFTISYSTWCISVTPKPKTNLDEFPLAKAIYDDKSMEDIDYKKEPKNTLDDHVERMLQITDRPPEYDRKLDKRTIAGVDNDNDGVRDTIEHLAWGLLWLDPNVTKSDYEKLLAYLQYIQPSDPPIKNSISNSKVKCDYFNLKDFIREQMSFNVLYWSVLDTSIRQTAYIDSLVSNDIKDYERCPEHFPVKNNSK